METIRGHLVVYVRGTGAAHALRRTANQIQTLEAKGYTTEHVAVYASTPDDDGHDWSVLVTLQNPHAQAPAVDSPAVLEKP